MRAARLALAAAFCAALLCSCSLTVTPPAGGLANAFRDRGSNAIVETYKANVARRIAAANPEWITRAAPQSMLRSVVVVSFSVDRRGHVSHAAVYRTNGDDQAEATALNTLRRASPLPPPPERLLGGASRVELMEGWLFNNDGRFQLQSIAERQETDD